MGLVCTGRSRARCACGARAPLLCDWKVSGKRSGTCDAPAHVHRCSTSPAPGKDSVRLTRRRDGRSGYRRCERAHVEKIETRRSRDAYHPAAEPWHPAACGGSLRRGTSGISRHHLRQDGRGRPHAEAQEASTCRKRLGSVGRWTWPSIACQMSGRKSPPPTEWDRRAVMTGSVDMAKVEISLRSRLTAIGTVGCATTFAAPASRRRRLARGRSRLRRVHGGIYQAALGTGTGRRSARPGSKPRSMSALIMEFYKSETISSP